MSLRARYTGPDGLVVVSDRPVKTGQVVADDAGGDITASPETIRELLARGDFEDTGAPAATPSEDAGTKLKPKKAKG